MTAAIFVASVIIGGAINPKWVDFPIDVMLTLLVVFAAYDALTLVAKFLRRS